MDVEEQDVRPERDRAANRCIYFPSERQLEMMIKLLEKYPRASLSSIMAQTVPPIIKALETVGDNERMIDVTMRIYL